jgi:DNA-binding NarL/FixJ family response regulator
VHLASGHPGQDLWHALSGAFGGVREEFGLELIGPLREVNPHARVLVMSTTVEMSHPADAMEAGAEGVIDKLAPFEQMWAAIRGDGGS